MSALWYEYLEESGGEVIASKYFNHVCRSLESVVKIESDFTIDEIRYAINHKDKLWWPIKVFESLSEGWIRFEYIGMNKSQEVKWWNTRNTNDTVKSIEWCVHQGVVWSAPIKGLEVNIAETLSTAVKNTQNEIEKHMFGFERIKIGGYLECWLEHSVGIVWPVRVLSNVGGRLRLAWFGCESTGKHGASATFVLFYLDQRLRGLGWAKENGWRYCAPENAGIVITISNADTFVRGSPGALSRERCNESCPQEHSFEEGWQIEAVDPKQPNVVRPAFVKCVYDRHYFLVEIESEDQSEATKFPGYLSLATLMPANLSEVSGFVVVGLHEDRWQSHLMDAHPDRYAPHAGYFAAVDSEADSAFLPGCKLEAVNPWHRENIHAATVTRCMDGSRLVWVRLDSEPDLPDFLVDPHASVDLFPVGWCEMMHHPLVLPALDPLPLCPGPVDSDDVTVFFYPQCFLGPFLSRSAATQILPRFIGPGHALPVFKELFHLLLKVSHKPHKLKRLLQLDNDEDHRDLMATIAIPSPKSEHSNRHRRPDWLVEVAVRRRAIPEFCRQTALSVGACPWFITTQAQHQCSLGCEARLSAKAGEKMTQQRRKRLFLRPLMAAGLSYRSLKCRIVGGASNSSSNSDGGESSEDEPAAASQAPTIANVVGEYQIQTRGVRLPVGEPRRRCGRRKPSVPLAAVSPLLAASAPTEVKDSPPVPLAKEEDGEVDEPADLTHFAIDPAFLAGDIARVTLASNPLHWSADQVAEYVAGTDCRQLASWLANERVDGPAFLLLTLPVLSTLCGMQLEPAIRLCRHVVSLKRAFVEQFADQEALLPPDL